MRIPTTKPIEIYNSKKELISRTVDKCYKYAHYNAVHNTTTTWGVSTIDLPSASSPNMVCLTTDYTIYNNIIES